MLNYIGQQMQKMEQSKKIYASNNIDRTKKVLKQAKHYLNQNDLNK